MQAASAPVRKPRIAAPKATKYSGTPTKNGSGHSPSDTASRLDAANKLNTAAAASVTAQ